MKLRSHISGRIRGVRHALRLRGTLASDPAAQTLHVFLLLLWAWMMVSIIVTLPLAPVTLRRLAAASPMTVGIIGALIVIRFGYYRAASLIYLASVWTQATMSTSSFGGIRGAGIIFYGTLPVSAAWLLGYPAALWTAGLSIASMLVFAVLEMTGMAAPYSPRGTPLGIWFAAGTATLVGAIPVAHVIRRLLATLAEREQVEESLRKSEERFRLATKATNDSIWDIDLATGVVSWNDTYANLYGRVPETSDSWQWWIDNIHPEERENTVAGLRSAIAGRSSSWTCEYRFRRVSGDWAYIYDRAYVARDASGNAWRVIGAMQDLTGRKAAEAALREKHKLESVGALAGGIAHDFNNLLGAVQAQTELALAELDTGSSCKEKLQAIGDVAMRGSEIVRQLLVYAGKESEVVELVDLSRIVEEMLPLLKVSVSKRATITVDLGQHLPSIPANKAQLRQIVMNLVTNASDALGERDGLIHVATTCVNVGPDSTAISDRVPAGDYVELEVADTGCGMSAETRTRLFEPFFTTKSVGSAGHGLGLAVVDGIVRRRGGAIRVTSELGKGTTFHILLPCKESTGEAASHAMTITTESASPLEQATVLVWRMKMPCANLLRRCCVTRAFRY